ncbi:MAG TPA: alpha/beta hydrolase [Burkholderiales bacterium]|nr:alpha/beta hydrolase [Burkholderiales bacterium]
MRNDFILGLSAKGFHRVHYTEWGDAGNPRIVVCVHGLTRTGRDFDDLARALQGEFRVACPDIVGRGSSDWLPASGDYGYPQYLADMNALIARLTAGAEHWELHWVGTSMGGIIGMLLAAQPRSPVRKLVVNDVGARIPKAALERIGMYLGRTPRFETLEALEAHLRRVSAPFGPLTDAQWRHLTVHAARQLDDGSWTTAYDPAIAAPFHEQPQHDIDLWRYWDAIRCPTLLVRGADSDLLPREVATAMVARGPRPRLAEFSGVGHAPMLMSADQIAAVREFLLEAT